MFDRQHGLTCDGLVGAELVTADGATRTLSASAEPDLFWALRGGGAARLGVVTSLTTTTFAATSVGRWLARWAWSDASRVVAGWQRYVESAPAPSWANLHLDVLADGSSSVLVIGFGPAGDEAGALAACVDQVGREPVSSSHSSAGYLATVTSLAGSGGRQSFSAGSSVPSAPLPAAGVAALLSAVADRTRWGGERHAVLDPLGGRVGRVAASETAFPWRDAPFTVQWYANLPLGASARDARSATAWVARSRAAVGRWAPGAYANYPSPDITDPAVYFGPSLGRLRAAAHSADPTGLFQLSTGLPKVE